MAKKNAYDITVTDTARMGHGSHLATLLLRGGREMQPAAQKVSAQRRKGGKRFSFNEMDQLLELYTLTTTRWWQHDLEARKVPHKRNGDITQHTLNVTLTGLQRRKECTQRSISNKQICSFDFPAPPPPWWICLSLSATYSPKISTKRKNWGGKVCIHKIRKWSNPCL